MAVPVAAVVVVVAAAVPDTAEGGGQMADRIPKQGTEDGIRGETEIESTSGEKAS